MNRSPKTIIRRVLERGILEEGLTWQMKLMLKEYLAILQQMER